MLGDVLGGANESVARSILSIMEHESLLELSGVTKSVGNFCDHSEDLSLNDQRNDQEP